MSADNTKPSFNISFATLFKIVAVGLLVYLAYLILDILGLVLVAIILATALDPCVDWLERYHLPRALSLIIIYLLIFIIVAGVIILMVPPLAAQVADLARALPYYYQKLMLGFSGWGGDWQDEVAVNLQQALQSFGSSLAVAAGSVLSSLAGIFGGIVQFIITWVITFYLVVEKNGLRRFVNSITPTVHQAYVATLLNRIQDKLGAWLRGELLLMLIIAVMTYFGLLAMGMPYALVLALWAGLTELVPYIGPILGAIPAVFLALSISPLQALLVVVLYILIQQLENNIIVPAVMKRAVGLNPIISIIAIMVGYKLGGIVGAIMAIPLVVVLALILSDLFDRHFSGQNTTLG